MGYSGMQQKKPVHQAIPFGFCILACLTTISVVADELEQKTGDLQVQFEHARGGEQLPEASQLGRKIVTTQESYSGANALELVPSLMQLAQVQEGMLELEHASHNYRRTLGIIESHKGIYDQELIEPLVGLSRILYETGQHGEAVDQLNRATHLVHRSEGVLSPSQMLLIDEKTKNYMRLGKMKQADREQEFAYRLARKNHGEDSLELVPGMYKLAAWYRDTSRHPASVKMYKKALAMLESAHGKDSLELVEPLRAIAYTRNSQVKLRSEGARVLGRAVGILEKHEDSDPNSLVASYIDLGDIFTMTDQSEKARHYYVKAWREIKKFKNADEILALTFDQPVELYFPALYMTDDYRNRRFNESFFEAEFDVAATGKVGDVDIVGSVNTDLRGHRNGRSLTYLARFRPRMVDGEPVATENIRVKKAIVYNFLRKSTFGSDGRREGVARAGVPRKPRTGSRVVNRSY